MLSSRVLSSALRAQSRNVVRRVNVRTIAPAMVRINATTNVTRNFQTSMIRYNGKEDLTNVLQSELKVTNTIPNTLDSIYEEFLVDNKWDLIEKDGQSVIELKKILQDGKIIRVFFDIEQITDTPYSEFDGEDADFEENGATSAEEGENDFEQVRSEVDELDKLMCNVRVLIENPTNDTGVFFNLILHSLENSFIIDYVSNQAKVSKFLKEQVELKGEFSDQLTYQGPRFSDLDESLQTQFETYLSEQGIDDQLAEFIVSYSEVKEEDEYRKWLSDLVTFFK